MFFMRDGQRFYHFDNGNDYLVMPPPRGGFITSRYAKSPRSGTIS
ncbi:hypothetical protein [Bremerella volcania]|nr:hypothetical protein [Bremerella volcania]